MPRSPALSLPKAWPRKVRKGIVGDWKNYFSREAGEVFDRHCGDVMVRLGYEADRDWWTALPPIDELRERQAAAAAVESPALT